MESSLMRIRKLVLIAVLAVAVVLSVPRPSGAWTSAELGTVYAGPYAYPYGYAPGGFPYYPAPAYYPPPYYPPLYYPPVYPPGVFWPGYGPDVPVRGNRYFTPPPPQIP